ncbi:MAG: LON peptidase substrate-binding domain-containing protein, partial [Chloroflexi bacterium]|nr:LON peptidase substrate-binding domain-containing protein [Chloroflexota bacterium]
MVNVNQQALADIQVPETLPVLPVRGMVVFPMAVTPLFVGQPHSIQLVDDVMRGDRIVALVSHDQEGDERPSHWELPRVGTAAAILQLARTGDGTLRLIVQGIERIRVVEYTQTEPYLKAKVQVIPDQQAQGVEAEGLRRAVIDLFGKLVALVNEIPNELAGAAESLSDPRQVAYFVASAIPAELSARQEILEMDSVDAKLRRLVEVLQHEIAVRELGSRITAETQKEMTRAQREYFLREQLKSIQRELGDGDEGSEAQRLRKRIEEAGLPEEARREAERELTRLESIPAASPEYGIITTYLDWMASLPWNRLTGGAIDVRYARRVLDEDHY